jgi:hypothetical protein
MKGTIFRDITPCSPLKVNPRFEGTYRLHLQGRRTCLARNQRESRWQAELCLEAKCSSETSVNFQRTTRRYIPEDSTLHETNALTGIYKEKTAFVTNTRNIAMCCWQQWSAWMELLLMQHTKLRAELFEVY